MSKVYLGDGAYADFDGFHVVLTTENGYGPTNTIFLEPSVARALVDYIEAIEKRRRDEMAAEKANPFGPDGDHPGKGSHT